MDESIIIGTFDDKEINEIYPLLVNEVLEKLKDVIYKEKISPQITIYIRDGKVFKYYIGVGVSSNPIINEE